MPIQLLINHFNSITPLSPAAQTALQACLFLEHFPKKTILQQQHRPAQYIYMVHTGLLRSFYHRNNKDITAVFGTENCIMCSLASLLSGEPSAYSIETLEDSDIFFLELAALEKLYDAHHDIERLGRLMITQYYLDQEKELRAIRFQTAEQRYQTLLQSQPSLLQRAPLGYIASYLGISQETLSRLRAKY
ncbi:CRP-like cAMP-binding protein [Chitinophaga skermanii]|uniref:CRP-like cAMP-binding protein n=1 Tax=Chitinophaga skermanii TaxID=331697 RepID=A0A327QLE5_9BACT|nr:Crp/Fnr family transcriptional regulator [Chitinophaga skermanii]RAJ05141.1 CRP-like cAMP-binding protein [Chitinophaga skermanii]